MVDRTLTTPDLLRLDYINSLPQPFLIRLFGDKTAQWPLESIDVQTGVLRFDVCGKSQVGHIGDVAEFIDGEGAPHQSDTFYSDYLDEAAA